MQHCVLHRSRYIEVELEENRENKVKAKDVKEGHFAVVAVKAGEEYGFKHGGAIAIPCERDELQIVLQEMKEN
ncbi:hypothetical protein L1987_00223 [Smallanthus sonchifolius]|uniref:Uncharacterized protein n=1 Tax=Smallanthus sonchifolius TaxID=185202 RepID=A0ACB9K1R7_9ASTR|nr:hypothetical protein L1987_00223 [Smallanthus sonchifolius]